jgi:alpha-L-glutamate ligase-like protein
MAVKLKDILGLNARNYEYLSHYNTRAGKRIADSKLLTKSTLQKAMLPVPRLYRVFRSSQDVDKYDFTKLPDSFVVKPNRGLGGEGIIVVESVGEEPGTWVTAQGDTVRADDLRLHSYDVLEGRFSMNDAPDIAFVEERIRIHPAFIQYAYHGTPDIGVLVFNRVPVMAFLRLPTKESGGRANMFQGAIACGIDIATGVTTSAVQHTDFVEFFPGTRRRLRGIQIPEWDQVMKIAIQCAEAVELGYMRADIVLQPSIKTPEKTLPKVLELNAQPGLKIQLCNRAGLKKRLERVEGLEVETPEKGIKIAKELFGDKELAESGNQVKTISVFETVEVVNQMGEREAVKVKIDTGAYRTSIDEKLAKHLGLLTPDNILMRTQFESALGQHERDVIGITFYMGGRKIKTTASVVDRSELKRPMIIGRKDLTGFVVKFD